MHTCKKGIIEKTGQGCCKGHSFMDLFLRATTAFKQLEGVVHDYGYLVFYTFNFFRLITCKLYATGSIKTFE
jgi:hypothetical protein